MDGVNLFGLPVDDMERAKKFFSKTFGWSFMATGMDGNHHFATTVPIDENGLPTEPGGINGGLLQRGTYEQQVTSIFIKVKSIDNTIDKVVKNGGKQILAKVPIADFAYFAQINDSEGNLISLWEDKI
ncbi:MAG: VOC family protein [Candidatus Lokiarchaeota archaeon]|nr:VOC family protein [Candidatus Lokiarchaeota archaeon]